MLKPILDLTLRGDFQTALDGDVRAIPAYHVKPEDLQRYVSPAVRDTLLTFAKFCSAPSARNIVYACSASARRDVRVWKCREGLSRASSCACVQERRIRIGPAKGNEVGAS